MEVGPDSLLRKRVALLPADPSVIMKLSRLRIEAEGAQLETGCDGEVIRCQRDLLPVAPLPDGPRKWGTFHLLGYWIAEGFGAMAFIKSRACQANGPLPSGP